MLRCTNNLDQVWSQTWFLSYVGVEHVEGVKKLRYEAHAHLFHIGFIGSIWCQSTTDCNPGRPSAY